MGYLKAHHILHFSHGEGGEVLHGVVREIVEVDETVNLCLFISHQMCEHDEETLEHLASLLLVFAYHVQFFLGQYSLDNK